MAVTVIGGLLTSTLLTLVLIPAVYTIMDDFTGLVSRAPRLGARGAPRATVASATARARSSPARAASGTAGQRRRLSVSR